MQLHYSKAGMARNWLARSRLRFSVQTGLKTCWSALRTYLNSKVTYPVVTAGWKLDKQLFSGRWTEFSRYKCPLRRHPRTQASQPRKKTAALIGCVCALPSPQPCTRDTCAHTHTAFTTLMKLLALSQQVQNNYVWNVY